jgi:hypothetical protein
MTVPPDHSGEAINFSYWNEIHKNDVGTLVAVFAIDGLFMATTTNVVNFQDKVRPVLNARFAPDSSS